MFQSAAFALPVTGSPVKALKIFDRLNRSGVKHAVYGYGVKLWVKVGYNVHIILQRLDRKPLHSAESSGA